MFWKRTMMEKRATEPLYTYVGVLCAKCKTYNRQKSCFDPNTHVPYIVSDCYCCHHITDSLCCFVWIGFMWSFLLYFFSLVKGLSLSLTLSLPQSIALAIPTSRRFIHSMCIFSWVFVGSCHCVVFSLFILLIFILLEFFLSLLELGHQCVFPSARTFFVDAIFFENDPSVQCTICILSTKRWFYFRLFLGPVYLVQPPSLPLSIVPFIL